MSHSVKPRNFGAYGAKLVCSLCLSYDGEKECCPQSEDGRHDFTVKLIELEPVKRKSFWRQLWNAFWTGDIS
jgi:hypothetical protein